ncbi:MAG: hypothetical protein OEW27_18870, partial [Aquincola sp.]|nr:hypothetical protein [Aquincola sp.]
AVDTTSEHSAKPSSRSIAYFPIPRAHASPRYCKPGKGALSPGNSQKDGMFKYRRMAMRQRLLNRSLAAPVTSA